MKKIIVGFIALAFLLVGGNAFASGWNQYPGDCPAINIGNSSTGQGISTPCWNGTNVSATASQTINVKVFYDNTTGSNANNTLISLTQSPSGSTPSTNFSFSGNLTSSSGSLPLSQVSASISSSQSLTFVQAKWYQNGSGSPTSLPNGQSGSEAFSGGLSLGTIPMDEWGALVFAFTVGSNQQNNCTISSSLQANPTSINLGNSSTLSWNTNGCSSVIVSGPNFSSSSQNGPATVTPTNIGSNVYTLVATGSNGQQITQTATVYVNNNNQTYCTITNFTANGSSYVNIQSGGSVNIVWNTNNCNYVTVSGPNMNTSYNLNGSMQLYPTQSGTYIINASGNNGNPSQTVYVNVNPTILPPVYTNTCAVTSVATNITRNSATLNGIITNSTGPSYFEYGTNVNLGSRTISRSVNGLFNEVITGLAPNTYYYFRPVSQCVGGGISNGNIEVFRTLGNIVTNNTVVVQGTTVIGTESPIMLKIENRYQSIALGDIVDYTVTYKNIGRTLLTHPILQVIIPKGITLINASRGTYAIDTNTLTVPLEDLVPGVEGVVFLQGHVDSILSNTSQVVTTAILVYTNPNGAQENAIAYVLNNPREIVVNNLGAAAFGAGFLGIGLIGWLLLIILILLIILLTRRYYGNKSVVRTTGPSGSSTTTTHY